MRTRLTAIFLAGIAIASLAAGASPVQSQSSSPAYMRSGHVRADARRPAHMRRGIRAPMTNGAAATQQKPGAKKTKQTPAQPPDPLTRPEFTAADEAAARLPGMPSEVRFWGIRSPISSARCRRNPGLG